jgi:hypothetical protein
MAEFKLGRLRFVWKDQWTTGDTYYKDDIIAYGGKTFLCVAGHTAAADFYTDLDNVPTKWNQFSDGQDWKGDWTATRLYKINDIVKYGGYIYICNDGHNSRATLELDQGKWDLFAESFDWKSAWTPSTTYKVNDLVKYGGYVYLCNTAHTSAATTSLGLENNGTDLVKWDIFSKGVDWKGNWSTTVRYKAGDVIKYGGTTYVCNLYHTSASTTSLGLEADQGKWDYFNQGVEFKGPWQGSSPGPAVRYKVNDIVKSGGGTYICVINHTSAALFATDYSAARWNQFVEGIEFEGDWSSSATYQPGDITRYGGNSYISKTAHAASAITPPSTNITDWDLFTTGFRLQGDWLIGTAYKVGEIVRNHGFTYVATADNTGQKPPNALYWSLLNQGIDWEGTWVSANSYVLGDAVKFGPNSYICIQAHTSSTGINRPDNDITGTYWNLLTAGNEESVLTTNGDLVYYSGSGPTRLPIGDEGQVLTVASGLPAWNYFGQVAKVFYVAAHGVNTPAPTYGLTIDKPWASVRYACEQIDNGTEYPKAAYLLKQNRTFIQKEIAEWVKYQIANPTGIWIGFTNDNDASCQRDMGLIVDAITHDLTHTGNVKTLEATNTFFSGGTLIASYTDEYLQGAAAINYGLSVVSSVLSNTAPAANYQTLNGISAGNRIKQIINTAYVAETTAYTRYASLSSVITTALTTTVNTGLPALDTPGYTINVKTGQYLEVLPIVVPANTAIVGDELRSTRMGPVGKLVATNDKAKSVIALQRLQSITDEIITNTVIVPTTGNTATQYTTLQKAGNVGSAAAITSVQTNCAEIKDIIANNTPNPYVLTTPTGGTGNAFTAGYLNAARLINANKAFLQDEVSSWILAQIAGSVSPFVGFTYTGTRRTKCERDVGYIVDALRYDITYGGNLATQIAARSYYSFGVFLEPAAEKAPALAVQLRIKDIIDNIATGNTAGWTKTTSLTQDVSGTAGSAPAASAAQDRIQEMYNTINTGIEPTTIAPDTSWVSASLLAARTALNTARTTVRSNALTFIKKNYPTLAFDETICSRDVGYMVDALGYDLMFDSNFLTIQSGLSYRRGITSTNLVIGSQLAATLANVDFIAADVSKIVATGAVVLADNLWTDIINYVNTGTAPITVGSNSPTEDLDRINGAKILQLNKDFLVAESDAYIANTFKATVTVATGATDVFTCSSQTWMVAGDTVRFTGTVFGGVALNTTYYILSTGLTATTFKISLTSGGTAVDLSNVPSGSMTVKWYYNSASCQNDVKNYIEAIAYDMVYTGNYKSVLAARLYRNALTGSKLEDMFYVRNGTGLRNCTLIALDGSSDGNTTGYQSALTTTANEYGTKRPRAGSYVSLDPGWGPNDTRVWVTTRSTYVQNVTTFGIGCVGQKIDGSLHAGGNDSIVSNDFTQVLSDGIGAWITNLGRAELVSVFSYYNYIGYLAENGGKIRATNGNNSYGTFGAVAEYIDITETPVLGNINNRNTQANVRNVLADGTSVLLHEFGNAGSAYNSAAFTISGTGASVATIANEFRDGAVFQVRLTDPGDSTGPGGVGYVTTQNLAQAGNTTQITLAAADNAASATYVGMSIYIIAGVGTGQYGYINTYNAGSKIATVYKESTGTAGWDHVVAGTPIVAALDLTSNYQITPRLTFSAVPFTKTTANLPSSQNWSDVVYGDAYGLYSTVLATGGAGSLASFNVTRRNGVYTATISAPGVLYATGNTLTIAGTSLGGTTPANDLTITVTSVSAIGGIIQTITVSGTAITPKFVAIASGTTSAAYSLDGVSWTAMTMPTAASGGGGEPNNQWSAIAYGVVTNVSYYVAVARATSVAAYSRDGINWTTSNLGEVADWCDIAFGAGTFVAVAESDSSSTFRAWSSNNGQSWNTNTFASGAKAIAYGYSRFVAVEGNFSREVAYSTNGATWTVTTMPNNDNSTESNWVDIAYGNGRYVAISDSSAMAAYSFNGATWYKSNLPAEYEWSQIGYGQGHFHVSSAGDAAATSPDGVTWTLRDTSYASLAITATAKDTNSAYTETSTLTTGTWTDVIWSGTKFVAVGYNGVNGLYASSTNGDTWTNSTLPTVSSTFEYTTLAYNGTNQYVALIGGSGGTRNIATSADAITWNGQVTALTANAYWKDLAFGNGTYVAIRGDSPAINWSTNGTSWTNVALAGGSGEMSAVAYGTIGATNYFVTVAGYSTGSQVSSYSSNNGATWTSGSTMPSSDFWADVAFGNNRFVAVAGGTGSTSTKAAYSINGTTWTAATMPGAATRWNKIVYGGGAFTAFAYNANRTAYSVDGITWVEGSTQAATRNWAIAAYGSSRNVSIATGTTVGSYNDFVLNTNYLTTSSTTLLNVGDRLRFTGNTFGGLLANTQGTGWYYVASIFDATRFTVSTTSGGANLVLSTGSGSMPFLSSKNFVASALGNYNGTPTWVVIAAGSQGVQNIRQGTKTRARAYVLSGVISEIWIHEPGSGYLVAPTMTITDPNNLGADATYVARLGNGAIAQPTYTNRGTSYTSAATSITGDGYADTYQVGTYVGFTNLTGIPKAGANVQIAGIDDIWYRLVNVTNILLAGAGLYSATLQLSPPVGVAEAPEHLSSSIIRRRYSQVRLTGHDFLDIGTGNQVNTNYPALPYTDPIPANETVVGGGGRVFYTSTDQDGNFRVGGLFNVEQSTGVATLNADAFNIAGLNELSLGSVSLGGSGATITEFSTDPFFTQDSDSVIPTQRAIKAYITSQIGGGGSSLNVNTLTAGVIYVAGQTITTTTNVQININTKVNFKGGIGGNALVLNYFLLNN